MPQIANLTVKKNDGTTDVTYTAVVPSGGDKSPALWRNSAVGTAAAHQPTLVVSSRNNGTGTARRVEGQVVYPTTVTGSDGKVTVADRAIISISGVIPQGMPTADVNEAVSQAMNLFATTLVKDTFKSGYAPT
jgi:hypothetical protein